MINFYIYKNPNNDFLNLQIEILKKNKNFIENYSDFKKKIYVKSIFIKLKKFLFS